MTNRTRTGMPPVPRATTMAMLAAALLCLVWLGSAALAQARGGHSRTHGHRHGHGHNARGSARRSAPPVAISPLRGTLTAAANTQISFLGVPAGKINHVSVVGSRSGRHGGHLRSYRSAPGASFIPKGAFKPGERVTVHARVDGREVSTYFRIAADAHLRYGGFKNIAGTPSQIQSFHSTSIKPPVVTVNKAAGSASASGDLFATPFLGPGEHGPMIFESDGRLVWFDRLAKGLSATDLKLASYEGKQDLVWWQGKINYFGFGLGEDVIADSSYKVVARIKGGNGIRAGLHEVRVLPDGAALITGFNPVYESTASVKGGARHAVVLDCVVQEVDIKTGLVMWEWHSIGHVPLSESHSPAPKKPSLPYDYFHINSIDVLRNGNIMISSRNTWAVYELSRITGKIGWQLGGRKSTFKLGKGVQFAWQHHVRMLPNGELTIFDDEGAPEIKPPTRGEILRLNFAKHTATLVGQLIREPEPLETGSQGDVQPLSGGNWMVGWGGLPNFTEFNAAGQVIYDAQFPKGEMSYRVYRFPWKATPSTSPAVVASTSGATTTVYVSWNGATEVARWELLTGGSPSSLTPVATVPDTSFETKLTAPAAAYVKVVALSAEGTQLHVSAPIAPGKAG